jgi:hypothetical protein
VQVKTDSKQLIDSPALTGIAGGVAKLAFMLSDPETIEKEAIKLLSSDYVKPKLISALSERGESRWKRPQKRRHPET